MTDAELSKIQITFNKERIEADTRQTVQRSVAALVARSVEVHERYLAAEAELTKLTDSINAPFAKLLQSDPAAMEAAHTLQNRQLIVPTETQTLRPEAPFVGGGAASATPPFDFSWNWHGGAQPFQQVITPSAGYVGIDARSGSLDGGASGVVNAHAGFGIILRVDEVSRAQAFAILSYLRFFYNMRAAGIGSNAVTDGGAEVTVLENGRLIANAAVPVWHRRISANESGTDSRTFDSMDVPPQSNPLRFMMSPGREYTFNVGFWASTDRSTGVGVAGVQGLVEGNVSEMRAGWGTG